MNIAKTQKDTFESYMSQNGEVAFIKEVLEPLFRSMGFKVTNNHGPNELGRDLVLEKTNEFKKREIWVAVVKKGNIGNTSKGSANLSEVKRQVTQCWETTLDEFGAKDQLPSKVLVICSGTLSSTARSEIAQTKNRHLHDSNTEFLTRDELLELLATHYPSFFDYHLPILAKYIEKLISKIKTKTTVETDFNKFVNDFEMNCQRIITVEGQIRKKEVKRPDELISDKSGFYWLQGGTGSGKTFTVYKLCQKTLNDLKLSINPNGKSNKQLLIPIYLTSYEINSIITQENCHKLLHEIISKVTNTVSLKDVENWHKNHHFVVVIDEYEQSKNVDFIERMLDLKETSNSHLSVMVLSRFLSDSELSFNPMPEKWTLNDINLRTASKLIKDIIPPDKVKSRERYQDLVKGGMLERIPRTPLALNVLSYVFTNNISKTPVNTYEFFEMFFELVLGKWEHGRDTEDALDYVQIKNFFQQSAHLMAQKRLTKIPVSDLLPVAVTVLQSVGERKLSPKEFILNICEYGEVCYIEDDLFSFTQNTYREFFAGCEIEKFHWNEEFVVNNIIDTNWEEAIIFAAGSKKRDDNVLKSFDSIKDDSPAELFLKFKNIGYLTQALYQSSESAKVMALSSGAKTAIKLRDSAFYQERLKKLFGTLPDVNLSLGLMCLFSSFFGRKNLFEPLLEAYKITKDNRSKYYLLGAASEYMEEILETEKIQELFELLPTDLSSSEAQAIVPYLEFSKKENPTRFKALLGHTKIRRMGERARKVFSKSMSKTKDFDIRN